MRNHMKKTTPSIYLCTTLRQSFLNFSLLSRSLIILSLLLVNFHPVQAAPRHQQEQTAEYRVTFVSEWSAQTHPTDFPSNNPHMSGLIGGTHNSNVSFWSPGVLADPGVQDVAERGNQTAMRAEVNAAISNNTAGQIVSGPGVTRSPDTVSTQFNVSSDYPLITLISMIAPSPDWFVGVHGLSLMDNQGNWINDLTVELDPYDSGTDSAPSYIHSNTPTNPPVVIRNLRGVSPLSNARIGTFRFERLDAPQIQRGDVSCNGQLDSIDALFILQYTVGLRSDSGACPLSQQEVTLHAAVADFNGSEAVDAFDALHILQCVVGLDNGFCSNLVIAAGIANSALSTEEQAELENLLSTGQETTPASTTSVLFLPIAPQ